MVGLRRVLCVVVTLPIAATAADAFGGRLGGGSSTPARPVSYSYYVAPVTYWYYYCPPTPMVLPVPATQPTYARPTPAPPSQTPEPPLQKMISDPRAPVVITTRSPSSMPSDKDRCRVGFWNLTNRDVTLTIDGKAWTVPANRTITLETGRQFTWQIGQKAQHVERVADGLATHEVVIRE